jgi:hypothetical protein
VANVNPVIKFLRHALQRRVTKGAHIEHL